MAPPCPVIQGTMHRATNPLIPPPLLGLREGSQVLFFLGLMV